MTWNRTWNLPLLIAVGAVLFLTNLGAARLWDVDEAIFSEAAREMHERGDLVVPYFNGELFAHKPPFLYWCQIAAYEIWGPSEFAARLGSALFGIGSMVVTYELGRILFGARAGLWGGLILGSCLNFAVIARAATPDSYLVFFCTLSLLVLVRGSWQPTSTGGEGAAWRPALPPTWRTYALAYSVMGLAVLVKGPVGVVLPTAVWGLFLLLEQNRWLTAFHPKYVLQTIWRMRPLTAVAAMLLVAGPWYAWVGVRTDGEFLREFFGVHNFGRFSSAMENHRGPVYYYLVALLLGSFPWCILLGPCVVNLVRTIRDREPSRSGIVLLASWVAVWVGFFSLAGTKLPSYIVPAYPAVALLLAASVDRLWGEPAPTVRLWLRAAWSIAALVGVAIIVAVPLVTREFLAGEISPGLAGCSLIAGAAAGLVLSESGRIRRSLATLAGTSVVFCTWLLGFSLLPIDAHQTSSGLAELVRSRTTGESPNVGSYCYCPPSFVFYSRQSIATMDGPGDVKSHFAEYPHDAFLVTLEERLGELDSALPADIVVVGSAPRFFKPGKVVVLGRSGVARQSDARTAGNTRSNASR